MFDVGKKTNKKISPSQSARWEENRIKIEKVVE
jgi:hypothetical protein